jgi:hypothetical protein
MRKASRLIFFAFCCVAAADVCDPAKLVGPYAFQLSGTTKISGAEKPTTSLGRLVFDGKGNLSGTASAMYTGLLLGNPVTGTYEAHDDCSIAWKLQDDSGAFQNFSGTISPDASRVQFRQTDPGGADRGIMQKAPDQCTTAALQPKYNYTVSGSTIPMQEGGVPSTVSAKGSLVVAESGVQVDSDCTLQFSLLLRGADGSLLPMKRRGYLVNGGKEILAIQTDPGAMVSGRFSSDSK